MPFAAAAGRGLDQQREADRFGLGDEGGQIALQRDAWRHRHAVNGGEIARADFVAHQPDRLGLRADEDQPGFGDDTGEIGILRQEAIARMDRPRAAPPTGRDDLLAVEIGSGRDRAEQFDCLVSLTHVQRGAVLVLIDRDGADAESPQGPDDPTGDFPAIGDEDFGEHGKSVSGGI